jgi:HK97 family phage major capsid protein
VNPTVTQPYQRAKLSALGIDIRKAGRPQNGPVPTLDEIGPIPTSPAELESLLGDSPKIQAMLAGGAPGQAMFGEFIKNYARATLDKDISVQNQVTEQVQVVLANWLKDQAGNPDSDGYVARPQRLDLSVGNVAQTSQVALAATRAGLHNPKAMGSAVNKDFKDASDFFTTIWHNTNRTASVQDKLTRLRNAFSSTVPSEGGFLIPETLRSELLRVALETGVVRQRARVIPMETLRVPFPAIDSTSNASSVYGGIVGYWTEEGAALTDSSASFGRIILDAKKLTAYTTVPNELLSDSIGSFQAFIDQIFPEALSFYEDIAFLRGTGVGEPLGALNTTGNGAIVVVPKEAGQPAASIAWENIVKMYARMLPGSLDRAVWLVTPDAFPELATMALSVGTGGSAIWLNNGVVGPPMTILGRPVIFTEKAPGLLGAQGDISFVDFGYYLIGDRQVMSAMSSPHFKFQNDQTAYRIIERVDGRPWLQSAITPNNSGPTLSPFVQLAAR